MRKKSSIPPTPEPERGRGRAARAIDLSSWGFEFDAPGDLWLERLRAAEAPQPLGSIGSYELLEEVGRGGQGVVFRARQPGTRREIALKRMLAGSLASESTRRRFEREIESAASLGHPGIVTVYGMERVDGQPVLAMEWVDGVPVTDWAGDPRRRDPREVLELFARLCDALSHAHARGVLHRDLKPSNVLVDDAGQPHVLDFGLAAFVDGERADESRLTRSSAFLGTPAYAAPEQLRGDGTRPDARADVYSLGVLLYEMLTGAGPHGDCSGVVEQLRRIESSKPVRPSALDPRLAGEVDTLVARALAAEPDERYATVDALAADVRRHLAGEPIQAVPVSSWALFARLVTRNPLPSGLAAALLLSITGFGSHAWWQARQLEGALREAEWQNEKYETLLNFVPDCEQQAASTNPNYVELNRPAVDPDEVAGIE